MGENTGPSPGARAGAVDSSKAPWWRVLLGRYLVPAAIASLVGAGVSVYTALNTHQETERTFSETFEGLVTQNPIMNAFKGTDLEEQRAASQLQALQAVADTMPQKRTVLLLAARLLNANTSSDATGGAAARLLTILIAEDLRDRDKDLPALIRSQQFLDLVTAGYDNDYYNDFDPERYWYISPTLNGDQPITHDAKLAILLQLSPPDDDGWIHLATFSTSYRSPITQPPSSSPTPAAQKTAAVPIQEEKPQSAITATTANDFLRDINEVNRSGSMARAQTLLAQYAIEPVETPAPQASPGAPSTPQPLPLFDRNSATSVPARLVLLKPRLLRSRPPLEFVNPDGSFHKGSLGTIIGAVAPGTCVTVVEPMHPVLVFVEPPLSTHVPGANGNEWIGLIHLWAHVRLTAGCGIDPILPHGGYAP